MSTSVSNDHGVVVSECTATADRKPLKAPRQVVRIAVIDSGWDGSVVAKQVQEGVGFVDPAEEFVPRLGPDSMDENGHGTRCAMTILGVTPHVVIVPVKVFGKKLETSPAILVSAIAWSVSQGCQVLNLSLGTNASESEAGLEEACNAALERGVVLVAASGGKAPMAPAKYPGVLGVRSSARELRQLEFVPLTSGHDDSVACVNAMPIDGRNGILAAGASASMACAHVSGAVALLLRFFPNLRNGDLIDCLRDEGLLVSLAESTSSAAPVLS